MSNNNTSFAHLQFDEPTIWREVVKVIGELEDLVWKDSLVSDEQTRAEGVRQLTRLIAGALPLTMEMADPAHPQFLQMLSTRIQWALPSADCHYQWAPVDGANTYRIIGNRGTARIFDMESRNSHFARLSEWSLFERLNAVEVEAGNHVEIILSKERPAGAKNWLKLPDGPGNIVFRQYFYDWTTEQPARLIIVNENAKYPPPPVTAAVIRERLALFCDFLRQCPAIFRKSVDAYYAAPVNSMSYVGIDYGWKAIKYGKGVYECQPDEALILELKLPKTHYWNIQIGNHFWEAGDYNLRQNSLNGHQVYIDEEGIFRAVISHQDPGIANWLDSAGINKGLATIRFYEPDFIPETTLRRIRFSELNDVLPVSTPRISKEERQKLLSARAWSMPRLGRD